MKIPKIIHYCWFGNNPLPENINKFIEGWKNKLPDYEFIEWNERNFNVEDVKFVREAYESKQYAFVTDYVRLYALKMYGGIYMDTDVEVIRSLDSFLKHSAFTGTEGMDYCVTGTMGAVKNHPWINNLLSYYDGLSFKLSDGSFNNITNTKIITDITVKEYGWTPNNNYQILNDDLHIYPFEYFCAKDVGSGVIKTSPKTHTIHHFSGSWHDRNTKIRLKISRIIKKTGRIILGENKYNKLLSSFRNYVNKKRG